MPMILTIGLTALDDIYPISTPLTPGQKHRAPLVRTVIGGTATNAAIAIARLGGEVELLTRMGDDATGDLLRDKLSELNIGLSLSRPLAGYQTSRSAILIEPNGDRTLANMQDFSMPDAPEWFPQTLPAGTSAILSDVRWETGACRLFALARAAGIPAILDGDRAPAEPHLIALATHTVFSAQGLRELTRTSDVSAGLAAYAAGRDGFFAVTDGGNGVYALIDGTVQNIPAFPITPIDTLGAGDTWHGAFALALAEGQPMLRCIRFASAAAAIKCSRPGGGEGAPARLEVEQLLAEHDA